MSARATSKGAAVASMLRVLAVSASSAALVAAMDSDRRALTFAGLSFFKNCLATRPVNAKNSDVPTIYWEPEIDTDPVDITIRC